MEGSSIYIEWISRKFDWGVIILNYVLDKTSHLRKQVERDILSVTEAKKFNKLLFT